MKRFLLGTLTGVLAVAVVVTFIPDRAHDFIDQAGQVRGMLEDVAARLERLEDSNVNDVEPVEVVLPQAAIPAPLVPVVRLDALVVPTSVDTTQTTAAVEVAPASVPESVQRQAVDFDNLAAGLTRVSGALERLNRTMKPGRRPSPKSTKDADPSS